MTPLNVREVRKALSDMGVSTGTAYNDKNQTSRRVKVTTSRFLNGKEKYALMQKFGAFYVGYSVPLPGRGPTALVIYVEKPYEA